jgi:hypothetical protein
MNEFHSFLLVSRIADVEGEETSVLQDQNEL